MHVTDARFQISFHHLPMIGPLKLDLILEIEHMQHDDKAGKYQLRASVLVDRSKASETLEKEPFIGKFRKIEETCGRHANASRVKDRDIKIIFL